MPILGSWGPRFYLHFRLPRLLVTSWEKFWRSYLLYGATQKERRGRGYNNSHFSKTNKLFVTRLGGGGMKFPFFRNFSALIIPVEHICGRWVKRRCNSSGLHSGYEGLSRVLSSFLVQAFVTHRWFCWILLFWRKDLVCRLFWWGCWYCLLLLLRSFFYLSSPLYVFGALFRYYGIGGNQNCLSFTIYNLIYVNENYSSGCFSRPPWQVRGDMHEYQSNFGHSS